MEIRLERAANITDFPYPVGKGTKPSNRNKGLACETTLREGLTP